MNDTYSLHRKWLLALALLGSQQACGRPPSNSPPVAEAPDSALADTLLLTTNATNTIDGRWPTLSLSCAAGEAPVVLLNVVRDPPSPPPLRGVYARFSAGSNFRIEMSSGLNGNWVLRTDDSPAEAKALVAAFLNNGAITMRGDGTFLAADEITWSAASFAADAERIRTLCLDE